MLIDTYPLCPGKAAGWPTTTLARSRPPEPEPAAGAGAPAGVPGADRVGSGRGTSWRAGAISRSEMTGVATWAAAAPPASPGWADAPIWRGRRTCSTGDAAPLEPRGDEAAPSPARMTSETLGWEAFRWGEVRPAACWNGCSTVTARMPWLEPGTGKIAGVVGVIGRVETGNFAVTLPGGVRGVGTVAPTEIETPGRERLTPRPSLTWTSDRSASDTVPSGCVVTERRSAGNERLVFESLGSPTFRSLEVDPTRTDACTDGSEPSPTTAPAWVAPAVTARARPGRFSEPTSRETPMAGDDAAGEEDRPGDEDAPVEDRAADGACERVAPTAVVVGADAWWAGAADEGLAATAAPEVGADAAGCDAAGALAAGADAGFEAAGALAAGADAGGDATAVEDAVDADERDETAGTDDECEGATDTPTAGTDARCDPASPTDTPTADVGAATGSVTATFNRPALAFTCVDEDDDGTDPWAGWENNTRPMSRRRPPAAMSPSRITTRGSARSGAVCSWSTPLCSAPAPYLLPRISLSITAPPLSVGGAGRLTLTHR